MVSIAHSRGRRRRMEWAALAASLLALVCWLSTSSVLVGANRLVQDASLSLATRAPHPDIVIVAIDDRSIASIGRWPWRRALHAELLKRLSAGQPLAIGLDILFTEEDLDYPADDLLMAQAIARSERVVLPVLRRGYGRDANQADLPLPQFTEASLELGHVHIVPDADGVVRALNEYEGPTQALRPHFSIAMQCAARAMACPPPPAAATEEVNGWHTQNNIQIAFGGGPGHYPRYSYIDVLRGDIPPETFRGKYVLVGAVAAGLGDMFATPVSHGAPLMPGVEIVAQALDARLSGVQLHSAGTGLAVAFNLLPVLCALLALLMLGPLTALLVCLLMATLSVGVALLAPSLFSVLLSPTAALLGLMLAYPLWSWRRLQAAASYLRLEMDRLQETGLTMRQRRRKGDTNDFLDRRINAVERATRQLRNLHHFVSESMQQLPAPTLVCDAEGKVLLSNTAARCHLGQPEQVNMQGMSVFALLGDIRTVNGSQSLITPDALAHNRLPAQSEGVDDHGRSVLVHCRAFTDLSQAGWLITLVDLTDIRRAVQQRDQAINFISHDIRAPNASILTLLEMQRAFPDRLSTEDMLARIERYAHTSLGMAENFVKLASAESQEYRSEAVDLVALLTDAVDDCWTQARDGDVELIVTDAPTCATTLGDYAMLRRAVINILSNAIKYSPPHTRVHCRVSERGPQWIISVRDEGPGIAPEHQHQLFAPFQRLHDRSHPSIAGIGLGLAFVHTVVQRHGGTLEVTSDIGKGADFWLILPQHSPTTEPAATLHSAEALKY